MGKRWAVVIGVAAVGVMALGAQTATSSTVDPVDRTPPDLQLSGKKKQKLDNAVEVKSSCGDEACQTGSHRGSKLTNLRVADRRFPNGDPAGPFLKSLGIANADLGPGETTTLSLKVKEKTRKLARKALDKGRNVQAKVVIDATDAAGNMALAKRTIKIVK
jgi:hypothetical protein